MLGLNGGRGRIPVRIGYTRQNGSFAGRLNGDMVELGDLDAEDVELLWVKGSGGDLGTLTPGGLAVLRLDRMRALVDVYPGVDREDEMVAAFDYCLHGKGGAAPSIDTPEIGNAALTVSFTPHANNGAPMPKSGFVANNTNNGRLVAMPMLMSNRTCFAP